MMRCGTTIRPAPTPAPLGTGESAPAWTPPATSAEAEARFWRRYGPPLLAGLIGADVPLPTTVAGWVELATAVRGLLAARAAVAAALGDGETGR